MEAGPMSGVTHAGGRYLHPANPYAPTLIEKMRELGIEPPPPPFLVAPGAATLFHEWGHHLDHLWSGDDHTVHFSVRWFSRFYEVARCLPAGWPRAGAEPDRTPAADLTLMGVTDLVLEWRSFAAELFASLFEDWMRGDQRFAVDLCEPGNSDGLYSTGARLMEVRFLPGAGPAVVRENTYALFERGQGSAPELPDVRAELFGAHTSVVISALREAARRLRAEPESRRPPQL
jgi:hypothetical protein